MLYDASLNPEIRGEIRLSIATPNVGYGPLEVIATDRYVCGTDTIVSTTAFQDTCADGSFPRRLVQQVIYHKADDRMELKPIDAGSMTYHPTHAHMHVDDWCAYSIRTKVEGLDPLDWPIVANGRKIGFCLSDTDPCDRWPGYCERNGEVILEDDFENFGLGSGEYADCDLALQGISVGYVDIYYYYLDDMDIPLPDGTCNGDYQLVVQADPSNAFLESNEDNNLTVIPITLSKQEPSSEEVIEVQGKRTFCQGESVVLKAVVGSEFEWSTGETTQEITIRESGNYAVKATNQCGVFISDTIAIEVISPTIELEAFEQPCRPESVDLSVVDSNANTYWYDSETAIVPIATGNSFQTPPIQEATTYYVSQAVPIEGATYFAPPHDNYFGIGGYSNPAINGALYFDVLDSCVLQSVKIYAGTERSRTIQLWTSDSILLAEKTLDVTRGEQRLALDFDLIPGTQYRLQAAEEPNFFRNNTDVRYPYKVDGLVEITGSNFDRPLDNRFIYYYFYDWEIKAPTYLCETERQAVEIDLVNCVGVEDKPSETLPLTIQIGQQITTIQMPTHFSQTPSTLQCFDIRGQLVSSTSIQGNQTAIMQEEVVATGYYLLVVENENERVVQKIFVAN